MVTVSSYEQDATMESAIGAAISLMVVAMMMKMAKGMMNTAGPMYAKKHPIHFDYRKYQGNYLLVVIYNKGTIEVCEVLSSKQDRESITKELHLAANKRNPDLLTILMWYEGRYMPVSHPYPGYDWQGNPIKEYLGMTTQVEFESLLTKLTKYDLSNMRTELYHTFNSYPSHSYGNKAADIAEFTSWARGDNDRIKAIMDMARKILDKKANTITSGPVPNTKYVLFSELTKSPNYHVMEPAIWFGYNEGSGNVNNPVTKDGYVSVYALYNINRWASWKSSSLSASEREVASELDKLIPYDLLKLNSGRKQNQPALFPDNMLA